MTEFLHGLISPDGYMPHGHCYLWSPGLVSLHVISDGLIALSYYSIPFNLARFVRRRRDLDFRWMFICFATFILACGATHMMEIWTIWHASYWVSGLVKAVTAVASVSTAILLNRLLPQAVKLPSPAALAKLNESLAAEVRTRSDAEQRLHELNASLQQRINDRTAELEAANADLRAQVAARFAATEKATRLAAIVDCSQDAIIGTDLHGIVANWNSGAEKMFGYTPEEIVERGISLLIPAGLQREEDEALAKIEIHGAAPHFETQRLRKDGARIDVSVTISPVSDGEGRRIGTSTIARDITQRKQAEARLQESDQRFQTMANSISQLAWIAGPDGVITWYNQRWYQYTGATEEQMKGRGWRYVHDPRSLPKILKRWAAAIASGQTFEMEFPLRGANGLFRRFLTRAVPFKNVEGKVIQWFGTNTDVDELKRVEEALRRSESSLAAAQSRAKIGNWEYNSLTNAVTWSDQMFQIFGRDPYLGPPLITEVEDMVHPDDRESFRSTLARAMAEGHGHEQDFRIVRPDNTVRWIEGRSEMITDAVGRPLRLIGSSQDITERKFAEDEVRRLNTELEQRVIQRTAQLEAANKELEAFSYSVSHDLRSPLRAIDGFSQALLDDYGPILPEDGREHLHTLRASAQKMGILIDDLLTFSRLGRSPLARRTLDTARLVRESLEDLKFQLQGRQLEIRCDDLPKCWGDPALLKQVWVNLLSNAIKYTLKRVSAAIEVGATLQNGETVFWVRDNGAGFDMRYVSKLFGVFQRLHRAEDYEGTGVGLAIVQRIIHRHEGRVWAEAIENQGATFYFTLEEKPPIEERLAAHQ